MQLQRHSKTRQNILRNGAAVETPQVTAITEMDSAEALR
jgi:hypothetical protein